MPWEIKKRDDSFCVYKKGASTPLKGGCHDTREEAVAQLRALYASENKKMHVLLPVEQFSDITQETDNPNIKWVQAWRYSTWDHPVYGKVEVTPQLVEQFKDHLDKNTYGQEILVNYDHGMDSAKGNKAAGRVVDIEARDDGGWYKVEFTDEALREIKGGEWRYLSPEYQDWIDAEKGETFDNVPVGLAITNRPFFKNMTPMNFSEFFTEVEHHGQEEVDNMDELLKKFAELFGIQLPKDAKADDDNVVKLFTDKITELKTAAESNDDPPPDDNGGAGGDGDDEGAEKAFAEQYPEQARELAELRTMRIANEARQFADQFTQFTVKEGDKEITKGLSPASRDKLTEIHLAFSEGKATPEQVSEVVKSVIADGVVEFGERGSSHGGSGLTPATRKEAATALRDRAKALIEEAGGTSKLSFGDALAKAASESPELAAAYEGNEGR